MNANGQELVLRATPGPGELEEIKEQVRLIANTEFVPKAYRNNPHAILACVLTGRGLGLDPMHALRSIYVVDGKPTLSAELMVALAREQGHSITGNFAPDAVTVKGKRGDNGDEMEVTWTIEMAKRAGLVGRSNWKNYPEAMLWARAVSQLSRMLFPDVVKHVSYVADEAERTVEEKVEGMVSDLPLPKDETVEEVPPDAIEIAESEIAEQQTLEEQQPATFEAPTGRKASKERVARLQALADELVAANRITPEQLRSAAETDDLSTLTTQQAKDLYERLDRFAKHEQVSA